MIARHSPDSQDRYFLHRSRPQPAAKPRARERAEPPVIALRIHQPVQKQESLERARLIGRGAEFGGLKTRSDEMSGLPRRKNGETAADTLYIRPDTSREGRTSIWEP